MKYTECEQRENNLDALSFAVGATYEEGASEIFPVIAKRRQLLVKAEQQTCVLVGLEADVSRRGRGRCLEAEANVESGQLRILLFASMSLVVGEQSAGSLLYWLHSALRAGGRHFDEIRSFSKCLTRLRQGTESPLIDKRSKSRNDGMNGLLYNKTRQHQ